MDPRTTLQKKADDFDRRLHALAIHAEREGWDILATELFQARRHIRGYMHPEDRKATS